MKVNIYIKYTLDIGIIICHLPKDNPKPIHKETSKWYSKGNLKIRMFLQKILFKLSFSLMKWWVLTHCGLVTPNGVASIKLQYGAIITWSNIRGYCIHHCKNWGRKETAYLAVPGELWDVFFDDLGENWLHYNNTSLYSLVFWQTWLMFFITLSLLIVA